MMRWLEQRRAKSMRDGDLVRVVLEGDRDQYAELVRRHQESLYRHARGMGIDHDTALDLVQDSFIKAFSRLSDCHDPNHFKAWISRIMRNLTLDYLKNVRRLSVSLAVAPEVEQIPTVLPDVEMNVILCEALAGLPPALREAFLLKHDANYTYEEVAEMTDATPSAVKMRVHRAREALRDFLVQKGVNAA
jgi:RNA polymerase sigma-70 factor (ECF subfamily)